MSWIRTLVLPCRNSMLRPPDHCGALQYLSWDVVSNHLSKFLFQTSSKMIFVKVADFEFSQNKNIQKTVFGVVLKLHHFYTVLGLECRTLKATINYLMLCGLTLSMIYTFLDKKKYFNWHKKNVELKDKKKYWKRHTNIGD